MHPAPLPPNESERLKALESFSILDSFPEQTFDDITRLAATICGTPIALISLVDAQRQWFKSRVGLAATQTPRDVAFCAHAILQPDDVLVVEDASRDLRFHDNPLVTSDPRVQFYAGAPIVTKDGLPLGTVCVIDHQPRQMDEVQRRALQSLSRLVVTLLEDYKRKREEASYQAERIRRHNELLLAVAMESLDMHAYVDANYRYKYVDRLYREYHGLGDVSMDGKHLSEVLGTQLFEEKAKYRMDRALAGEVVQFDADIPCPRGMTRIQMTYLPARGANGEIVGVILRGHDVQRLKEREDQLSESLARLEQKTLEQQQFIHIVSHDLREPVNSIVNFSGLLDTDFGRDLPSSAQRYLEYVQTGGRRLKTLLDDLISYVRLDRGLVERTSVDLNQLMSQVLDDFDAIRSQLRAEITFANLPVVQGEASLLRIVLQNLLSNAIKYVQSGVTPNVEIYSRTQGERVEVHVRDNGIGIAPEHLSRIFDLFQRLHKRSQYEGTGLGLSICRRIAIMHGGDVRVESVPGRGSTFVLSLPARMGEAHTP